VIAISLTKSAILNQIAENKPSENCVLKKLRFENAKKNDFSNHRQYGVFWKRQNFKRIAYDFKGQITIFFKRLTAFLKIIFSNRTF
jgi:hypothetical protein